MQRSAFVPLAAGLLALVLTGCPPPPRGPGPSPLPAPLMYTRPAQPPPVKQVAPAPPTEEPPAPATAWIPPGGFRPGRWQAIVVHHAATDVATPQSMHRSHLSRGWENGLGYHFVIGNGVNYPDARVYVGPRWTAQLPGAHCKTGAGRFFGRYRAGGFFNDYGIGICLIGNFEEGRPTAGQMAALRTLIAFLCQRTGIRADEVYGHREVTHKTQCPGRYLNMDAVRQSARLALAEGGADGQSASTWVRYGWGWLVSLLLLGAIGTAVRLAHGRR